MTLTLCVAVPLGCATADPLQPSRGSAVQTWPVSDPATVRPAPHSAYYSLWDDQTAQVIKTTHVNGNEPIGFRREDHDLVAVAGWSAVPIDDHHPYTWRLQPGDPVDEHDKAVDVQHQQFVTGVVIVTAGAIVFGAVEIVRLIWIGRHW